jgi:hypothetical protein
MFDVNRQPMITEIRCCQCRASMAVNSDDRRTIDRSITDFQRRHHCRSAIVIGREKQNSERENLTWA